jgi:hypothetical protein
MNRQPEHPLHAGPRALTLLIGDEVLSTSNDTSILNTLNCLRHANTGQHRVGRETLPVPATLGSTANGTGDRSEDDVDTLALVLFSNALASAVDEATVEGSGGSLSGWEDRIKVSETDTDGRILHAETAEAESRYGTGVADTLLAHPATQCQHVWPGSGCNLVWDERTYPVPVVRLTFSARVNWLTNALALA